jgi:Ca-activated chloride channel family protein
LVERDAGVVLDRDSVAELHRDGLPEAHRPSDMVADRVKPGAGQAQVTTRLAAYRLIGYENRVLRNEDFRNDAKDAGDMGSGHTCTALYEIVPTGEKAATGEVEPLKYQTKTELTEAARSGEWLTVRMRYKHPETDKASEVSSVLPTEGLAKESSGDLRFAAAAAAFGMVLRDSEYRGTPTTPG